MTDDYQVPALEISIETEVKKSRFIAIAKNVMDRGEAMAFLDVVKRRYPDARHHCWAYSIGSPHSPNTAAMSDDGEPGGTAGKPIFNVLQHKNIGDIMIVVVRYFGGIKLGAGGLVRAYSAAAQSAITALPTQIKLSQLHMNILCDFQNEQLVRHWLSNHDGVVTEVNYCEQVLMSIAINKRDHALFEAFLLTGHGTLIR